MSKPNQPKLKHNLFSMPESPDSGGGDSPDIVKGTNVGEVDGELS